MLIRSSPSFVMRNGYLVSLAVCMLSGCGDTQNKFAAPVCPAVITTAGSANFYKDRSGTIMAYARCGMASKDMPGVFFELCPTAAQRTALETTIQQVCAGSGPTLNPANIPTAGPDSRATTAPAQPTGPAAPTGKPVVPTAPPSPAQPTTQAAATTPPTMAPTTTTTTVAPTTTEEPTTETIFGAHFDDDLFIH